MRITPPILLFLAACAGPPADTGGGPAGPPDGPLDLVPGPVNLDLGVVFVGDSATGVFGVLNRERIPVSVRAALEVSRPDGFSLAPSAATLPAGEYVEFAVTVAPAEWDDYSGHVAISDEWGRAVGEIGLTVRVRIDEDGDGYGSDRFSGEDCDDADPTIHPGAEEEWYDGTDQDCDGASDFDQDGDGADAADWGGADCDDTDPAIGPDAEERWYDGVDQDCDGASDYDQDGDGADAWEHGGDDCVDDDPAVGPAGVGCWTGEVDPAALWSLTLPADAVPASLADDGAALLIGAPGEGLAPGRLWQVAGPITGGLDLSALTPALVGGPEDALGASVAAGSTALGATVAVGAPGHASGDGAVALLSAFGTEIWLTGPAASEAGRALVMADFDGDGRDDLAVAGAADTVWVVSGDDLLSEALLEDVGAAWTGPASLGAALGAGDLDRDGRADLLVGAPDAEIGGAPPGLVAALPRALQGGVTGDAATRAWVPAADHDGLGAGALAVADLDGDGVRDLVASAADGAVWRWADAGAGRFTTDDALGAWSLDAAEAAGVGVHDLDQDGTLDLLISGAAGAWLVRGGASGPLPTPGTAQTPRIGGGGAVALAGPDWTADGWPDVARVDPAGRRVRLLAGPAAPAPGAAPPEAP